MCSVDCVVPLYLDSLTSSPGWWVKLNLDSMAQGTPGKAVVGDVFRDYKGSIIGVYCFDVDVGTTFFVNILTVIHGIEYAHQHDWHRLWIELDPMAIIQCLQFSSYLSPGMLSRWHNYKSFLFGMRFYYSHIYGEGNTIVGRMASMAWWDTAPP